MRKNALKAGWMKPRYVLAHVNRKTCETTMMKKSCGYHVVDVVRTK